MSAQLSGPLIEQMLQGLTPKPWASVTLHTGEPPGDPSWSCARSFRYEDLAADLGYTLEIVSMSPGITTAPASSGPLGTVLAFREPGEPLTWEPGNILGRIDAALEDWERGEDAMRWRPE